MATVDLSDRPHIKCEQCGSGVTGTIGVPCDCDRKHHTLHRPNLPERNRPGF